MRCALCNHPLLYPEIYIDLLPVGPRCARRAGLVELARKKSGVLRLASVTGIKRRKDDQLTLDLFEQPQEQEI